jgi:hypothetical protein
LEWRLSASRFNTIIVNSNYPTIPVVTASFPPIGVLLYNDDPTNTIYLAQTNAMEAGDINNTTPLPPGSSVTFDGTLDVFASTLPGLTAALLLFPSGSSYFTSTPITPIQQEGSASGSPAAVLGPGVSVPIVTLVSVSQFASYDMNLYGYALSPGSAAAPLTMLIQLYWFDDLISGIPVFEEDWEIWLGRTAPSAGINTLSACGPMHGKYMSVNVDIPSGAASNAILQYINLFGSNRTVPYSDWRQNSGVVNPQTQNFTIIQGASLTFEDILASVSNDSLAASTNYWLPLGLYSGPIYYRFDPSSALTSPGAMIINASGLVSGDIVATASCPGILKTIGATAAESTGTLLLPRGPCALVFNSTTTAPTVSFICTAQQAA